MIGEGGREGTWIRAQGAETWVTSVGLRVRGEGLRAQGAETWVTSVGLRVGGAGLRAQGAGTWVTSVGLRVRGEGCRRGYRVLNKCFISGRWRWW